MYIEMIDSKKFIIKTCFHDFNKFLFQKTKLLIKKIYFYKKKHMNKKREFLILFPLQFKLSEYL